MLSGSKADGDALEAALAAEPAVAGGAAAGAAPAPDEADRDRGAAVLRYIKALRGHTALAAGPAAAAAAGGASPWLLSAVGTLADQLTKSARRACGMRAHHALC